MHEFFAQDALWLARRYIKKYLAFFIERRDWHMFTFLAHEMLHIVDDAERFGCGLGHISAYAFESSLAIFPKVRSPVLVHPALRQQSNGLHIPPPLVSTHSS